MRSRESFAKLMSSDEPDHKNDTLNVARIYVGHLFGGHVVHSEQKYAIYTRI